jgi:hypothetical protein
MTRRFRRTAGAVAAGIKSGPETDPFFAQTVLLCHADGSNGAISFSDSSSYHRSVFRGGAAVCSTAQVKFGTTSAAFAVATSDYLYAATAPEFEFGTGDYTVECYFYANAVALACLIGHRNDLTGDGWEMFLSAAGEVYVQGTGSFAISAASTYTANAWHHLAICRASGTTRVFLDGNIVASGTVSIGSSIALPIYIGRRDDTGLPRYFDGFIDDIRVTAAARYTAAFTPRTSAFPNS